MRRSLVLALALALLPAPGTAQPSAAGRLIRVPGAELHVREQGTGEPLLHGDRDIFFPVDIPVAMYRHLPKAQLWIVPDGDHVPIYDPLVPFADVALHFLQQRPR